MTFEAAEAIEGADVITAVKLEDGEGELMAVDRFPFATGKSDYKSWADIQTALRCTHELAKDRRLMQIRTNAELRWLVVVA